MYAGFDEHDLAADYLLLLRRGSVVRRLALDRHPHWELAMRDRAGADELRIRTWSRAERPATVWAVLQDWSLTRDEHERLARRLAWLRED
jgi:hypothetical protein